jgi:acetyl esterase
MRRKHHDTGGPDVATDPRIDPRMRSFLAKINKESSPFWELPQPQQILTALQEQTAVDLSGRCRRVDICGLLAR